MDDDFEDLLDEGLDPDVDQGLPGATEVNMDADPLKTRTTMTAQTAAETTEVKINNVTAMPSENELRLGRKIVELERERDALAAELTIYKTRFPSYSTTIPVPPASTASATPNTSIEIPNELLPVLAILRKHIVELTRDNQALRYTFLGQTGLGLRKRSLAVQPGSASLQSPLTQVGPIVSPQSKVEEGMGDGIASSSKMTLDVSMTPSLSSDSASKLNTGARADSGSAQHVDEGAHGGAGLLATGVDLEGVVERVKELIKENEELGEMVLEAGRRDTEDWEKVLEESKAVITSLDSDLTNHAGVVQSVREQLSAYQNHFGPLPSHQSNAAAPTAAVTPDAGPSKFRPSAGSGPTRGLSIRGAGAARSSESGSISASTSSGRDGTRAAGLKRPGSGRDSGSGAGGIRNGGERGDKRDRGGGGDRRDRRESTPTHPQSQDDRRGTNGNGDRSNWVSRDVQNDRNERTERVDRQGSTLSGFGGAGGRHDDRGSKRRR